MCDVNKNYIRYVIFEKNWVGVLPHLTLLLISRFVLCPFWHWQIVWDSSTPYFRYISLPPYMYFPLNSFLENFIMTYATKGNLPWSIPIQPKINNVQQRKRANPLCSPDPLHQFGMDSDDLGTRHRCIRQLRGACSTNTHWAKLNILESHLSLMPSLI